MSKKGIPSQPENILVTTGSRQTIDLVTFQKWILLGEANAYLQDLVEKGELRVEKAAGIN
ncbi:hypothetical protein [Brevibacillus choshinensis]|uniref:Uncharacterized protein n=1 Tax=Brevibacillus choshinensis TaxID=54911 RepID=A0ABX7FL62_BRECH|nr:hypothetical protein [Brevibacillus choshinensis]QRG66821.1 hypothetical protein JNE38_25615 [Brevibacillus choshinensis]